MLPAGYCSRAWVIKLVNFWLLDIEVFVPITWYSIRRPNHAESRRQECAPRVSANPRRCQMSGKVLRRSSSTLRATLSTVTRNQLRTTDILVTPVHASCCGLMVIVARNM